MRHTYQLIGYDRRTERLVQRFEVPREKFKKVLELAHIAADDVGDMPLSASQAREIGSIIGVGIDLDRFEYFLEPYASAKTERETTV